MDSRNKRFIGPSEGDSSRKNNESCGGSSRRFDAVRDRATSQEQERETVREWDKADEDSRRISEIARNHLPQSDYEAYQAKVQQCRKALLQPESGYNHKEATDAFMALNQEIKTKLVYTLTQVETTKHLPLTEWWESDPHPSVKAAIQMMKNGTNLAVKELGKEPVAEILVGMLTDKRIHADVRQKIPEFIANLKVGSVTEKLHGMLKDGSADEFVDKDIVDAIVKLGGKSELRKLLPMLSDKQTRPGLGKKIAETFTYKGDESMLKDLLPVISNKELDSLVTKETVLAVAFLAKEPGTKAWVANEFVAMLSDKELHPEVKDQIHLKLEAWKYNAGKIAGMLLNKQLSPDKQISSELLDQMEEVSKHYEYKTPFVRHSGWG